VAPLVGLLADGNEAVRSEAIYTIGAIGTKTMVQPLSAALANDASPAVRKHAAWALGQIGDLSAVPALTAAKTDSDPLVASVAAAALARMR
jgi:HEAT repeat protein